MKYLTSCPNCGSTRISAFYELLRVPVHSVILLETREEALHYPKGDIRLGFCQVCGFISNLTFDGTLQEYSSKYEATQGYSSTFNIFHRQLASRLIDRYNLHGKRILEIGCGQGEFLSLLCDLGNNRGIGFDPAYVDGRSSNPIGSGISFISDFYSDKYADIPADFFVCKMTLEHIHQTGEFMDIIRQAVAGSPESIIFFQVPNARYVFGDIAFWDIYYEHCSYFSPGSLARLFRRSGFEVENLWTDYDDQYLMIEARPGNGSSSHILPLENDLESLNLIINRFQEQVLQNLAAWKMRIQAFTMDGKRTILWGGGSKAVSFLTTLEISTDEVMYVVDINPYKSHTYIAGTAQEIIPPGDLQAYRPDVVVVMNPIYMGEVQRNLENMGLYPELLSVDKITG